MIKLVLNTHRKLLELLPKAFVVRFWWLQVLLALTSLVDLFGIASFIPVLSGIANPTLLHTNRYFLLVKDILHVYNDRSFLMLLLGLVLLFLVFRAVFILFSQYLQNRFAFIISEYIGNKAYAYYLGLDYQQFVKLESATIIRELVVSPGHFARFIFMPLLLIYSEVAMLILVVLGIAAFNFQVFLLIVCSILPTAWLFQRIVRGRIKEYGKRQNEQTPILYSKSTRGINGYLDAKLMGKEQVLLDDYSHIVKMINQLNTRIATLNIIPAKLFELVTFIGVFIIFLFAGYAKFDYAAVLPIITVYAAAGYRIIPSLSKVSAALMQLDQFSYLFGTYTPILKIDQQSNSKLEHELVSFDKEIRLNNIRFHYANSASPIFDNINLEIAKGEVVGIVGRSGAGKTSLINILIGLLVPSAGRVTIDGVALDNSNRRSWMDKISYVQQNSYLENTSLAANIAFLQDSIDHAKLMQAIHGASLDDFVNGRDPFAISITESGKNISGGQRQRICIARALYRNTQLLVLDEANASLDKVSEDEINKTIQHLKGQGVTVVIIAHRYEILEHTDKVYSIEQANAIKLTSYEALKN